jgi:hypothetical protein
MDKPSAAYSEIAEAWIVLDGKDFDLTNWPMHREFYDGRYDRTLLKTSRQVGKSTTLANFEIIEGATIPHFSSMYVSPSKEQTVRYSATRVAKTMRYSPIIKNNFLKTDLSDRVLHKQFTNGSEMLFTYAMDDADRLRGPSTDRNLFDEVQDILYDPVITIGNETMAQSEYAYETYAGTPKSMENTIQYLWSTSSQTEWVMKCSGCSLHQFVASERSIGKDGPICLKCGKYLNPFEGFWVDTSPYTASVGYPEEQFLKGFHFCQPIMPQNVPLAMSRYGTEREQIARKRWGRILRKLEDTSPYIFRTEVLGVSDSKGMRLITREDLEALCTDDRKMLATPHTSDFQGIVGRYAGVDWSGGGESGNSRTALWIWGLRGADRKLVTMFYKVYPGEQPLNVIREIAQIIRAYQVELVVGDAGEGHYANDSLRELLGVNKVYQAQYGAYKEALVYGKDRFLVDRTMFIDSFMMGIKHEEFVFGNVHQMKVAFDDIMNEYEEVTRNGRKVWRHFLSAPDDCLHAAVFGWIAYKVATQNLSVYRAGVEIR